MGNAFDLLCEAHAAHANYKRSRQYRARSKNREMWVKGARRCVEILTNWLPCGDGRQRNIFGTIAGRLSTTPSRTLKALLDDLFYDCPGSWSGGLRELSSPTKPVGYITVGAGSVAHAVAFLAHWCIVDSRRPSRHEGGIQLKLRPRKNFVKLLYTLQPRDVRCEAYAARLRAETAANGVPRA